MTNLVDALIGQAVSLVCVGEYVSFIHFGDDCYCRFEVEVNLVEKDGLEIPLLPDPSKGSIARILGKSVLAAKTDCGSLAIQFEDCLIKADLIPGYECVMIRVGEDYQVLMTS